MSALPEIPAQMTETQYLAFERSSRTRHEYIAGDVYAMSGASRNHNLVVGSTYAALYQQLREQPCELYPSDMKVWIQSAKSFVYPDISAVCEAPQFHSDEQDILLNPILIIEVLSPSTERYDRGKKFQQYRELASLREYLLIAQDSPRIECFVRQEGDVWQFYD